MRTRQWRHGSRSGSAILEFALSFVLIFPLLAGSFQFGYSFYVYNRMQTAVEGGARYASLRTYDSETATPSPAYLNAVRNQRQDATFNEDRIVVTISDYPFRFFTPLIAGVARGKPITVSLPYEAM